MTTNDQPGLPERTLMQFRGFLKTPPLWEKSTDFKFQQFQFPEQQLMDPFPPLHVPERLVLGKRIEYFFDYFITQYSKKEVLAANQQIISDKLTLGEIDFILKDPAGEVEHVELVYKFYVYDPAFPTEKKKWIGPNRRDSLVKKLHRLNSHQFPLLYRRETQDLLSQCNLTPKKIRQKVCFKANLFVPRFLLQHQFPLVNNACIAGFWIRREEFTEKEFGNSRFYSPKKQDWPIEPQFGRSWFSFEEILEQISKILQDRRSPLLWMKTRDQKFFRFFIVWW